MGVRQLETNTQNTQLLWKEEKIKYIPGAYNGAGCIVTARQPHRYSVVFSAEIKHGSRVYPAAARPSD